MRKIISTFRLKALMLCMCFIALNLLFPYLAYSKEMNKVRICDVYENRTDRERCFEELGSSNTDHVVNAKTELDNDEQKFKAIIKSLVPMYADECFKLAANSAKYQYRKTGNSNFRFVWPTKDLYLYIYGDNIELQNGFNAWSTYTFFCMANVQTKEITLKEMTQGKIFIQKPHKIYIPSSDGGTYISDPNNIFLSPEDLGL